MTASEPAPADDFAQRSTASRLAIAALAIALCAAGVALGNWQLARRAWKLDLIARVEQRVHAAAVAAPGVDRWPQVSAAADEYRHVRLDGVYRHDRETLVQAATERGSGCWVLTPLRTVDGAQVLVNRGFVPPDRRDRSARAAGEPTGEVTVTGLLRISEPGGGFLRRNDPAADRWFSRDVQAIAAARGLGRVAPFFIDADATARPGDGPVGGLTVTDFRNNHLAYAITWYALAAMAALAAVRVMPRRVAGGVRGAQV